MEAVISVSVKNRRGTLPEKRDNPVVRSRALKFVLKYVFMMFNGTLKLRGGDGVVKGNNDRGSDCILPPGVSRDAASDFCAPVIK